MRVLLASAIALVLAGCQAEPPAVAESAAPEAVSTETSASAEPMTDAAPAHVGLMAHQPWSRPLAPGATVAAGYMHLMNHSTQAETLIAAKAEGVGRVELHDMVDVDGVMQMRPIVGGVALAVDGMASFQPGGKHLMFFDVSRSWAEGETVPVSLVFESGEEVVVDFAIGMPSEMKDAESEGAADEHAHH